MNKKDVDVFDEMNKGNHIHHVKPVSKIEMILITPEEYERLQNKIKTLQTKYDKLFNEVILAQDAEGLGPKVQRLNNIDTNSGE